MSSFSPAIKALLAAPENQRRLGPYLCKELLDQAGTAPVFHAVEEHGGRVLRDVAVKVFDLGEAEDGERVIDEARSLCRVQHPNVVRFHTLANDPKKGLMGLVMELAKGTSLDRELAELPKDDPRRVSLAVDVGIAIASALAAVHEAGIAHCNIKPSNIMLTEGAHKLLNFGIAASVRKTRVSLDLLNPSDRAGLHLDDLPLSEVGKKASTLAKIEDDGNIIGTIGYLDPYCLKTTNSPSASSDLYSLGATLYQCLTGDVPAVATAKKNGKQHLDKDVLLGGAPATPVAELAPSTPADLAKLVDQLVAPTRDGRPRSADLVRHSLERIRSALAGHARELPPESRGPFPGLARYEASDRDVFFGRAAETAGVIELLRTRGLVCILGLAGVGKSSLARAALLPAIEDGALGGWPAKYRSVIVTPGKNLWSALEEGLGKVIGGKLDAHPEAAFQQLAAKVDAKGEGIVLLVDQLEEVVTQSDGVDKGLDLLSRIAAAPAGIRVIATARRDLLDDILALDPHFARALSRGSQQLSPVARSGWSEVLDRSFEAYGYALEDDELRSAILSDLDKLESAMPLAQFGLAQLWATRDTKKKVVGRSGFDAKRGLRAALEKHANATVSGLKEGALRDTVLALTTPEGTRAHVAKEALDAEVVAALEKARLVVDEKDGVVFVHDAVLREWDRARGWIEASRDDRLIVAHAERDAKRWVDTKDPADLWRKGRLAAALEIWKASTMPLSDAARKFLAASAQDEHKAARFKWLVGIGFLALILGGLLFYVKITKDGEERALKDAQALAAALAEVKTLKQQAEEAALESQATAKMLHDLQEKSKADHEAFGANVKAALSKVTSATSLDSAQKAAESVKVPTATTGPLVPIPSDIGGPKLDVGSLGNSPSPSAGGGAFDQAAIERVVAQRKAGVKRTCLERSGSTASSTKVAATITIAPNGTVQSVSSAGDDPAVAKCIEQQLKSWTFPAPGETKQVQIPFVFVRQ